MLVREAMGAALLTATAVAVLGSPATVPRTAPGELAAGGEAPWAPVHAVHPCPETAESACRAVFLPPLAANDDDGGAHTSHQPQVRICGPLNEGVSWQSVSDCDQWGTGEQVEHFSFGCGNVNDCVTVTGDHYRVNWRTSGSGDDDDDGDADDDDGDDDDDGGKGKGKGGDDDDSDDDDDDDGDDGDGSLENGYYLINVRLNGSSAGGIVVELAQGGGGGEPPRFNNGSTVPVKFRLHDKIIG